MGVVFGLSLTGYLLPWDQKGFFATQVATNILGSLPGIGSFLQKVVVGGPVYGNQTLTHFYALHVGILPPLLIVLLIAHVAIFRRHGITTPYENRARQMENGEQHGVTSQALRPFAKVTSGPIKRFVTSSSASSSLALC